MDTDLERKLNNRRNHRIAGGVILIIYGAAILAQRWLEIGDFIVLLIGLSMLVWGSVSRRTGWIIPGGVLTGIGVGILAFESPWFFPNTNPNGIFLLCFAFGWFLITILTALFTCTQWWALIPGGIMALIGGSILVTSRAFRWEDFNPVYAVILISLGLFLLVYKGRPKKND